MRVRSAAGQSFSMQIVGYEFPDEELGPTEDNPADEFDRGRFLIIAVEFSRAGQTWQASGPEMKTNQLERLANWLQSIVDGTCSKPGVYFTERDLEFSVDQERAILHVHIFSYFLPKWADGDSLRLDFPLNELDLESIVHSLRDDLARFPGRPPLEGPG